MQSNVIPEKLTAVFDIRLAVTVDHEKFEATVTRINFITIIFLNTVYLFFLMKQFNQFGWDFC